MGPSTTRSEVDVELLERAVGWTRMALAGIRDDEASLPTPCTRWRLQDLLVHMVDALEALTELSLGRAGVAGPPPTSSRPTVLADHLRVLGCALLEGWMADGRRGPVAVGSASLDAGVALEVAALEIAVHGWDLASARHGRVELPARLAAALLPVAVRRVPPSVREGRFAPPRRPEGTDPASMLLAQLGRPADGWG